MGWGKLKLVYSLSCYFVVVTDVIEAYRKPTIYIKSNLTPEFSFKVPTSEVEKAYLLEALEEYFIIDNEDLQGFNQFVETVLKWKKSDLSRYYTYYVGETGRDYHKLPAFAEYIY